MARSKMAGGAAVLSLVLFLWSFPPGEATEASATSKVSGNKVHVWDNLDSPDFVGFERLNFHVMLHVEHPFVFFDETKGEGNGRFSGITVDVLEKLGTMLNCTYTYKVAELESERESAEVALHAIGAFMPTGGLHTADIAAGAIHITANRSRYVHFSLPYFDTYYRLVIKRPVQEVNMFSFFAPFTGELWALFVLEILLFGACFFVMESPFLNPGMEESDVVEGAVGLFDSVYWALGAVTGMVDKTPKTWGGRIALIGHGWFMMIMLASYTANLASFLTTKSLTPSITNFLDVAQSAGSYKMAVPTGLSHEDFLRGEHEHHGYVFNYDTTSTWEESLALVKDDATVSASFMDEPNVLYYMLYELMGKVSTEEMCKLMVLPGTFRPAGYGLAFGQDSLAFVLFSQAIMVLKEDGTINKIVNNAKYMVGRDADSWVSGNCTGGAVSAQFTPEEFYGLCIMSGAMLGIGLLISVFERYLRLKAANTVSPGDEDSERQKVTPEMQAAIQAGVEAGVRAGMKHFGGKSVPDTSVAMPGENVGEDMESKIDNILGSG